MVCAGTLLGLRIRFELTILELLGATSIAIVVFLVIAIALLSYWKHRNHF
jgi:hypothetical protein